MVYRGESAMELTSQNVTGGIIRGVRQWTCLADDFLDLASQLESGFATENATVEQTAASKPTRNDRTTATQRYDCLRWRATSIWPTCQEKAG